MTATQKLAKTIRILTLAPLLALETLMLLRLSRPELFRGTWDIAFPILFLTILPLLAYPLQYCIPPLRRKGREMQRKLAILLAVVGYFGGAIWAFASGAAAWLQVLMLTYLISGALIALFNRLLHIRASGHACGVSGPVLYLLGLLGGKALWGLLMMPLLWWASRVLKRHTGGQLLWGSALSAAALVLARCICGM